MSACDYYVAFHPKVVDAIVRVGSGSTECVGVDGTRGYVFRVEESGCASNCVNCVVSVGPCDCLADFYGEVDGRIELAIS